MIHGLLFTFSCLAGKQRDASSLIQHDMYFPTGSVEPKLHPPYKSWRTQRDPGTGGVAAALQSSGLPSATRLIEAAEWRRNISSSARDYWCPARSCSVRTLPAFWNTELYFKVLDSRSGFSQPLGVFRSRAEVHFFPRQLSKHPRVPPCLSAE